MAWAAASTSFEVCPIGRVLDVTGGPAAQHDGAPIQQYDYLGGANQRWLLQPAQKP